MKDINTFNDPKIHRLSVSHIDDAKKEFNYKDHGKLVIAQGNTYHLIPFKDIICLASENNYTYIYTVKEKPILVSKTLKTILSKLDQRFIRTHRSSVTNLNHILSYTRGEDTILLTDQNTALLSRSKKAMFIKHLNS